MDEMDMAYANLKAAKRRMDESIKAYLDAVVVFERVLETGRHFGGELTAEIDPGKRLPKGLVEEFLSLIFLEKGTSSLTFRELRAFANSRLNREISDATLRQTLGRMVKSGKLERYGQKWTRGMKLTDSES